MNQFATHMIRTRTERICHGQSSRISSYFCCKISQFHKSFILFLFLLLFILIVYATCSSFSMDTTLSITTPSVLPTQPTKKLSALECRPFTVPDTRPFFEREPPQLNLPRRISDSSRQRLLPTLRSLKLAAVACAFNVEKYVDKFRQHLEPIVDLFHPSSRILIFESDSTDNTLVKLRQWLRAEVHTNGSLQPSIPSRSERIAYCRNELLNKARGFKPDYMLFLDLDIFAANISSFLTNFDYNPDDWSVMTANTIGSYYDIWALRTLSDSILNFDVWHKVWELQQSRFFYCPTSVVDNVIGIHQKQFPPERDLLEVRSAFGGAGLYKMQSTESCQYSGADTTCEHVPFHTCMREKNRARIFINPTFLIS